jgi:phospholipid N-methyltransferase
MTRTNVRTRFSSDKKNQMATKIKIEPELQAIKLPGTTTIRAQRTLEKSKEEKPVVHMRSKNQFFYCNLKQNYNRSMKVTVLPDSFDY